MWPWIMFVLAVVLGLGGVLVEKQKLDGETRRAVAATQAEEKARSELSDVEASKRSLEARIQELESQNSRLNAKASAHTPEAMKDPEKPRKAGRKHHKRS
jgi:hypothetical protein